MSRRPDPDLDSIFAKEPGLERYSRLLGGARLKPPPLDPGFRHALRRQLMTQAYDRYEKRSRPGFLATLFSGPRMAAATVLVGAVLVAFLLVANANLSGSGQVTITTIQTTPVAVDQPIQVTFSQPMDHSSVEQAIQIQPATQATYTWQGNTLAIQPVSGELAPNTQYHVTVSAAAKTAPGTPIAQPATVAVTTAPLPSPSPTPAPSPTPVPEPKITAEQQLAGTSGTVIGFAADGGSLFFLASNGDLDSIGVDGTGLRIIHAKVGSASVAPADTALAFTVTGQGGGVFLAGPAGENPQLVDNRAAQIIGWLQGKPFLLAGTDLGPAGTAPVAKLPGGASEAVLAPNGKSVIATSATASGQGASPAPVTTYLFGIGDQSVGTWTSLGQDFAWSPDSSRVAFWSAGSVQVANPDGKSPLTITSAPAPVLVRWTDDGRKLMIGSADGAWIVGADGSDLHQLSSSAFNAPLWAPGDGRLAYQRGGSLWIDDVSTTGAPSLDLGAAATIVDAFEKARIAGDGGTAAGLLGPSASPVAPSPLPTDGERLERYFVISSQATATGARFTARLIYARGKEEVRYQDEQLVIVSGAAGLHIDSVTDGPVQPLGTGPTVNSVKPSANHVELVFDSDLDPATVAGAVTIVGADGKPVAVTTHYDSRKLTLDVKLAQGQTYQLTISSALKDIAGHPIQGGFSYSFVAPAPGGD
jgi:Bacterial Ig-like domain